MSSILKGLQLNELSNKKLGDYKTAAGADATAADKEGNYKRGDKRMSGIIKATKKQVANDERKKDVTETGIPFRGVGGAFNRGDDERHDLDVPKQVRPQVWGLKINGKVWSKGGKSVTFNSKDAALNIRNSILKNRPDLEIGLITKGGQQGMAEATGDKPFDNMMKNISKGTNKQKTLDRKEQQKQTQQRARDAFDNMFGGGNPADKLKIREQGVAEGSTNSKSIITETRTYKLWESAGKKLYEAQLTADQINQIFQQVEQGATAAGGNRTMLGRGKDATAAISKAWEELKTKVQNSGPIKGVDAMYDKAAEQLKQATGGDQGVMQYVQKYRDFAKKHPIAQSLIYSALIAAAGISGAGIGGAAALGLFKLVDKLLQGEKFSSAAYAGAKTGGMAYAAGQIGQALKGTPQQELPGAQGAPGQSELDQIYMNRAQGMQGSGYTQTATGQTGDFGQPTYNIIPDGGGSSYDQAFKQGLAKFAVNPSNPSANDIMRAKDYAGKVASGMLKPVKESVELTESQIFLLIGKIVERHRKLDEGIMDTIKGAAGKAVDWAKTKGTNLTTKVTADKLLQAWKKAGSPTDSLDIASIVQRAGVPTATIKQVFTNMKIPVPGQPAVAATPGQPAVAATPGAKPAVAATPGAKPAVAATPGAKPIQTTTPAIVSAPAAAPATKMAVPAQKTTIPQVAPVAKAAGATAPQGFNASNVMKMPGMEKYAKPAVAKPANFSGGPTGYSSMNTTFKQPAVKPAMAATPGAKPAVAATPVARVAEEWSQKYKSSINCSHPKGFSQKAHCAGKKKHNESIEMEMVCEDCGMCQTHGDHSHDNLEEACWKGYHKEGNKKMFGKQYPDCRKNTKEGVAKGLSEMDKSQTPPGRDGHVSHGTYGSRDKKDPDSGKKQYYGKMERPEKTTKTASDILNKAFNKGVAEEQHSCPHCGGEMVSEELMNEKKDACYYKVKSRYSVWPSAYASGALVKCRKKGASNWGNGGKKNESSILEGIEQADESLHDWFNKEKWVRMDTKGKIKGPCAREPGEGKPKCLPQAKAHSLGKKGRASAAQRKRREDPNPDRHGSAINVNTKKKSNENIGEGWREKLGAAALAGSMALGAAGAHARVTPDGQGGFTGGLKPTATVTAPDNTPSATAPTASSDTSDPFKGLVRADSADRQAKTITVDGKEYGLVEISPTDIRPRGGQRIVVPQAVLGERGIGNYTGILVGDRVFVISK